MKRYSSLFFLLLFFLSIGNAAQRASVDKASSHVFHQSIAPHYSLYADSKPSMQNKKPIKTYTTLLFRMGIEGKNMGILYNTSANPIFLYELFNAASLNSAQLNHLYSRSSNLSLSPGFLSAYSCHSPPAYC